MNNEKNNYIYKVISKVKERADRYGEEAAYGGRFDDGGKSRIEEQIRFYKLGMEGEIPEEWEKEYKGVLKESDPEYLEYLRLKRKFNKEND